MLVSVSHLSHSFGPTPVLAGVSFLVNEGDRLGLTGANGTGKSTLLHILAGDLKPDAGEIVYPHPLDVGYLPQEIAYAPEETVDALVRASHGSIDEIGARLREIESQLEDVLPSQPAELLLDEHAALSERFERLGGYDLDRRVEVVFEGLGIGHLAPSRGARFVETLSGGEKARVGLACLLLRSPELLLLDEPTNHLDAGALVWLEQYLRGLRAGVIVVSHDRAFLDSTVTAILELDEHLRDVRAFPGSYSDYLVAKEAERTRWEEAYEREQGEIHALQGAVRSDARRVGHTNRVPPDNDKFAKAFFGGNVQRAISRNVRAAEQKLKRLLDDPIRKPPEPMRLHTDFNPDSLSGRSPVTASGVTKHYAGRLVLDGVSLTIGPRTRLVLTGPNGAGKSTLLRILAGQEQPDSGSIVRAPAVRLGYLDQEGTDLDPALAVFEAYRAGQSGHVDALRAELFRYGFFHYADIGKRVGDLSVGQRRKLQLARLLAARANLLLLDEPTNHVDFPTLEAFEAALETFPGAIVAVSHDRRFIEPHGWRRDGPMGAAGGPAV